MHKIIYLTLFLLFLSRAHAQNSGTSLIPYQADNQQFGFKNTNEQIVIEAQFQGVTSFHGNFVRVKQNNLWGLINNKGKWVIPAAYDSLIWIFEKGLSNESLSELLIFQRQGKLGIVNTKNKLQVQPLYDVLVSFGGNKLKAGKLSPSLKADTLFGVIDIQGKELIPFQYHFLDTTSQEGILIAGKNKIYIQKEAAQLQPFSRAYGLINWSNKQLVPVKYKDVRFKDGGFEISPYPIWKIVDEKGNIRSTIEIDSLYAISEENNAFFTSLKSGIIASDSVLKLSAEVIYPAKNKYIIYRAENKYGILQENQSTLQLVLPATYDSLVIDENNYIRAAKRQNKSWYWSILITESTTSSTITKDQYNWIEAIREDSLILVKKNKLYGYIDKQGTEVISLQFDSLGHFVDSICVAVSKGKYGILRADGSWLFEPKYDYFDINQIGNFLRKQNGKFELVDSSGKVKYSSVNPLRFVEDGSVAIVQKGKTGRVNAAGNVFIPPVYDSISVATPENTFWAYTGKNIFLYKENGEMLIQQPGEIEKIIIKTGQEYLPAKKGGRYGFVDALGRFRIANRYEDAKPFIENLAAVKLAGKWGFLNMQEKIVVQPYYDEVSPFSNGKAIVKKGEKFGIVDKQGKTVTSFIYDKILPHETGNFIVETNGKKGMLNKNGFKTIYEKYDQVYPQSNGLAIVQVKNKLGLLDEKGIVLIPIIYDNIVKNPFSNTYTTKEIKEPSVINTLDTSLNSPIKNK